MGMVQAAMGLVSLFGASKEAKAAKKQAKAEAAQSQAETQEKVYQLQKQERQLAGQTRARVAASGVKADQGSPLTILAEQASTFERERMLTKTMGAQRATQAMQRGKALASSAMFRGVTGAIGAFGAAGAATAGAKAAGVGGMGSFFSFKGG